jgi:hypothetical protein
MRPKENRVIGRRRFQEFTLYIDLRVQVKALPEEWAAVQKERVGFQRDTNERTELAYDEALWKFCNAVASDYEYGKDLMRLFRQHDSDIRRVFDFLVSRGACPQYLDVQVVRFYNQATEKSRRAQSDVTRKRARHWAVTCRQFAADIERMWVLCRQGGALGVPPRSPAADALRTEAVLFDRAAEWFDGRRTTRHAIALDILEHNRETTGRPRHRKVEDLLGMMPGTLASIEHGTRNDRRQRVTSLIDWIEVLD